MAINPTVQPGDPGHAAHHRALATKANQLDDLVASGRLSETALNSTIAGTPGRRGYRDPEALEFTRFSGNPVLTQAAQNPKVGAASPTTAASIYWPWIIKVGDLYYLYYSTNHGGGGIWLAIAPAITGPWVGQGRVYVDATSGSSTETPSVLWNEDESLFFMYYQQEGASGANGTQSTILATSPDGITWTRVGIVLDIPSGNKVPGDGHTGYFVPFRLGKEWYGYSLYGGGNYPHFALWRSRDGRTWVRDPELLRYGTDQLDENMLVNWNSGGVVQLNGRLWWIGLATTFVSGGGTKDGRIIAAPLSSNMRSLQGRPKTLLYPPVSPETTNLQSLFATVDNGKVVIMYQTGTSFNVAVSN